MNLYEAIYARYSVRKYRMEPVEDKIIDGIFRFLDGIGTSVSGNQNLCEDLSGAGRKAEVFRSYGSIGAALSCCFYRKKEKSEMNAGYVMQQIALYLTSKGVGSCYQGGKKKHDAKLEEDGFFCAMVMAFGYPKNLVKNRNSKRLSLEELCAFKAQPKAHTKELLEMARLSPSSFNSQPWRFVVYENRFHVFSKKPVIGQDRRNKYDEFNFWSYVGERDDGGGGALD